MIPRELTLNHLRATWAEALLIVLTISAAVAVVVFQNTLTGPTEEEVHGLAHRLGKNMLLTPAKASLVDTYSLEFSDDSFPETDLEQIRNSELAAHVRVVSGALKSNVKVQGTEVILVGSTEAARLGIRSPEDAWLGRAAAEALGLSPGQTLSLGETTLQVRGIVDPAPDGVDLGVFTSVATAQAITGKQGRLNEARLGGCWCSLDVPELGKKVEALLPKVRATTIAGMLKAQKETVTTVKRYTATTLFAGGATATSVVFLLLGVSVRRDRRLLALIHVAGAERSMIAAWVILRAALLGAAGGAAGWYLGGSLATTLAPRYFGLSPVFPTSLLWPSLLLASAAALIGSAWPALTAARSDPTTSLREE